MTSMPLSYLKSILDQTKLDEITYESEMEEEVEKEGEREKEPVPSDERVEAIQKANNRGKGSDLSVLRKEDKTAPTAPRRRKSGKLSKPESK